MMLLLRLAFVMIAGAIGELMAEMWCHRIVVVVTVVATTVVVVHDAHRVREQVIAHGEIFVAIPTCSGASANDDRRRRFR